MNNYVMDLCEGKKKGKKNEEGNGDGSLIIMTFLFSC
jgi:hypothetical protein